MEIRAARDEDGDALGRYGAALARQHHGFDPQRFMLPDKVEQGYRWWLLKEAKEKDAVVIVAVRESAVLGYAYGRLEERDWNLLLDACGGFHDIWVDEAARGQGLGEKLAQELYRRLVALGAARVVLMSAAKNLPAQKLFAKLGWRPTMVEMTREAENGDRLL